MLVHLIFRLCLKILHVFIHGFSGEHSIASEREEKNFLSAIILFMMWNSFKWKLSEKRVDLMRKMCLQFSTTKYGGHSS